MVGLIIPGAWIVLFRLTTEGLFLRAALNSFPGECRLSLNMELGMTYSNCRHPKHGHIGVTEGKKSVFCFILATAIGGGISF